MQKDKIYLIHAYEGVYGGLHGMETSMIVRCTLREAEDIATDESYGIMQSYSCIYNSFAESAGDEGLEEGTYEYEEFIEQCMAENVSYSIWEVVGRENEDLEVLEEEFQNSPYEFIEKYCKDPDYE